MWACGRDLILPHRLPSLSVSSLFSHLSLSLGTHWERLLYLHLEQGSTSNGVSSGFATGAVPFLLISAIEEKQWKENGSYQGLHGGYSQYQVSSFSFPFFYAEFPLIWDWGLFCFLIASVGLSGSYVGLAISETVAAIRGFWGWRSYFLYKLSFHFSFPFFSRVSYKLSLFFMSSLIISLQS